MRIMSRIKIVQLIGIILFVIYFVTLVIDILYGVLHDYSIIVFSGLIALISLNMFNKGVLIKSNSTIWFAMCLILFAIITMVLVIKGTSIDKFILYLAPVPIIASIVNILFFNNIIFIKIIILNISLLLPLYLNEFVVSEQWIQVIIYIVSIIFGIVVCRSIDLDKGVKNGEV